MYNVKSKIATEFIDEGEILETLEYAKANKNNRELINEILEKAKDSIKNFNEKSREEALWLHFLSIVEFWQKDESPSFEKTDLFIEKTIDTGFEFLNNEPLKKIIDLGKFLWKEKFQKS